MSAYAKLRRLERINNGLCTYCGQWPQFWGLKCIFCRDLLTEDPLPTGARRALRLHRIREARHLQQEIENEARRVVKDLLATKTVTGKYATALRLYAGVDSRKWRSYAQVAKIMHLSRERVRQLLLPSKSILSFQLSGCVPWAPVERVMN